MTGPAALTRRVAELEDKSAIRDLVYRYAENIHCQREGEIADLYVFEGVFESRQAIPGRPGESSPKLRFEGVEAIAASFREVAGSGVTLFPMIHNLRITLDGDEARSTCVMISAIFPHGSQFIGEYRDRYRRTADGWRFVSRTYLMFGDARDGTYAAEASDRYDTLKT